MTILDNNKGHYRVANFQQLQGSHKVPNNKEKSWDVITRKQDTDQKITKLKDAIIGKKRSMQLQKN